MSHFTVLVVGENVKEQLAPFHEFECTGVNDEHVVSVDKLPEALEEYNEKTTEVVRFPDGREIGHHDDECYPGDCYSYFS